MRLLGIRTDFGDAVRFPDQPDLEVRQLPAVAPGWKQKLHYLVFCLWTVWHVLSWRPSWVYASDILAAPAVVPFTFLRSPRVVYHEHDAPDGGDASLWMRFCLLCRGILLKRADLRVAPNRGRAVLLERAAAAQHTPVHVVWNCPRRDEVEELGNQPLEQPGRHSLRLHYHGSINEARLPRTVVEALVNLEDVDLSIVGYETIGSHGYISRLWELATQRGVDDRIRLLGEMNRQEMLRYASSRDVGLSLMPMEPENVNHRHMTGASNKPFDYLACGLALVVSDLPDWRAFVVDEDLGRACDPADVQSVERTIRWFAEHHEQCAKMGLRGRRRVLSEWNYDTQFQPVLHEIRRKP